jgi:hypothetical protein
MSLRANGVIRLKELPPKIRFVSLRGIISGFGADVDESHETSWRKARNLSLRKAVSRMINRTRKTPVSCGSQYEY